MDGFGGEAGVGFYTLRQEGRGRRGTATDPRFVMNMP